MLLQLLNFLDASSITKSILSSKAHGMEFTSSYSSDDYSFDQCSIRIRWGSVDVVVSTPDAFLADIKR